LAEKSAISGENGQHGCQTLVQINSIKLVPGQPNQIKYEFGGNELIFRMLQANFLVIYDFTG
jgi:hypothetical protein